MIKGKTIDLFSLERYDLLTYLKWINNRELINLTGMPRLVKSMTDLEKWYVEAINNPTNKFFSIKTKSGEYIGNIELNSIDWINRNTEIGILIGEKKFHGKGIGTEATLIILNYIFNEINLHRTYLSVSSHNSQAIKLYEKCGFKREGIRRDAYFFSGKYYDIIEMGLLKMEFQELKKNKLKDFFI